MRNLLPAILFVLGVGVIFYGLSTKKKTSAFDTLKTPALKARSVPGSNASPAKSHRTHAHRLAGAVQPPPVFVPSKRPNSETAVAHMNALLKTYAIGSFTLNDVIDDLEKRDMSPLLMTDSNPHTGTMYVLRTDSPLPGTRYFHAQYFTDEHKEPYLQHMSFDVKPDKNAFQDAIASIKKVFGNLSTPKINTKDFIVWPWKKGYNIWVQKMDKDQLVGDPYNAYAANDAGTIKIAVELDTFHGDHGH